MCPGHSLPKARIVARCASAMLPFLVTPWIRDASKNGGFLMRRHERVLALLVSLFLSSAAPVSGQSTGYMAPPSDPGTSRTLAGTSDARRVRELGVLLFDPSLKSAARTTNWTVSLAADRGKKEAKLQFNLCDLPGVCDDARRVFSATLVGPVDSTASSTELADLDGLAGKARLEVTASFRMLEGENNLVWGGKGRVAPVSFKYRDASTLDGAETSETAWSVEGFLGYRWGSSTLLQAKYRVEESWKPGDKRDLCVPSSADPPGTLVCEEVVVGGPKQQEKSVLGLSLSQRVGGVAAFRLEYSVDVDSEVWGVGLPVYIIPSTGEGLAGGVQFGYRSDEDQLSLSVFVSLFKL